MADLPPPAYYDPVSDAVELPQLWSMPPQQQDGARFLSRSVSPSQLRPLRPPPPRGLLAGSVAALFAGGGSDGEGPAGHAAPPVRAAVGRVRRTASAATSSGGAGARGVLRSASLSTPSAAPPPPASPALSPSTTPALVDVTHGGVADPFLLAVRELAALVAASAHKWRLYGVRVAYNKFVEILRRRAGERLHAVILRFVHATALFLQQQQQQRRHLEAPFALLAASAAFPSTNAVGLGSGGADEGFEECGRRVNAVISRCMDAIAVSRAWEKALVGGKVRVSLPHARNCPRLL